MKNKLIWRDNRLVMKRLLEAVAEKVDLALPLCGRIKELSDRIKNLANEWGLFDNSGNRPRLIEEGVNA